MKKTLIPFAMVCMVCSTTTANVGHYSGSGATLVLSKTRDVQMVSEDVTLVPMLGLGMEADRVEYRCRFVLKNLLTKRTEIQVGFPVDQKLHRESALSDTERVLLRHFIARDKQNTYHVRCVRERPAPKSRELFMWDMAFSPSEEKTVHVQYVLPMSVVGLASTVKKNAEPTRDRARRYVRPWYAMLEPCTIETAIYITETGNSWHGTIEQATFRIPIAGMAYWMGRRSELFLAAVDPPLGSSSPARLSLMNVGLTYLQFSPQGDWKRDSENGDMTWSPRNYKPGAPIQLTIFGTALPADASKCESVVERLMGSQPKAAHILELSEMVAAFFGVVPETESVKEFVERQVWYHPKKDLRPSGLTDAQREIINRLEKIAKEADKEKSKMTIDKQ